MAKTKVSKGGEVGFFKCYNTDSSKKRKSAKFASQTDKNEFNDNKRNNFLWFFVPMGDRYGLFHDYSTSWIASFVTVDQLWKKWSTVTNCHLQLSHDCSTVTGHGPFHLHFSSHPTVTSSISRKYYLQGRYIFRPLHWHEFEMKEVSFSVRLVLILN